MSKIISALLFIASSGLAFSQLLFEEIPGNQYGNLHANTPSQINAADLDGDGADEIFCISSTGDLQLFKNNGSGFFSPTTVFPALNNGQSIFMDVDNDNDLDFVLTGSGTGVVYKNDGTGLLSSYSSPFSACTYGAIDTADIEHDGDVDIIIGGSPDSKIYLNDGNGNFTVDPNNTILVGSGVCFDDFNGDGFADLFISGNDQVGSLGAISKYYQNNGSGIFVEQSTTIPATYTAYIKSGDLDGDGDNDIVMFGSETFITVPFLRIYLNDGSANFTELSTSITPIFYGCLLLEDVELDGDLDILVSGQTIPTNQITNLYLNSGSASFSAFTGLTFDPGGDRNGAIFLDFEGDGDKDFCQVGTNVSNSNRTIYEQISCIGDMDTTVTVSGIELTSNMNYGTYYWYDCNSLQNIPFSENQTFTPSYNGDFAVVINAFGCIDTSDCKTVSTIGFNELSEEEITLYPNPTSDYINITSSQPLTYVIISDASGKQVRSIAGNQQHILQLDLSDLQAGIYVLDLFANDSREVVRVVKR